MKPKGPKPKKPWPKFPLTPHASGTWCKKVRGKLRHFGPWSDSHGALARWEEEAPALRAGKATRAASDAQTLKDLCNRWLLEKMKDAEAGAITWGHYSMCRRSVRMLLKNFDAEIRVGELGPDGFRDFGRKLEAKYAGRTLRKIVRTIIGLFAYAADEDWIERPVKLGKRFRLLRKKQGDDAPLDKARKPADVRRIIDAAERRLVALERQGERSLSPMRQLIAGMWLAVNGGYGSSDLAEMPRDVVDLDGAVIDYRRGKTKMERVVPLMPETAAALRRVLAERQDDELVFRTREGQPWRREMPKRNAAGQVVSTTTIDNFQQAYAKLLNLKSLRMKRPGCGFYELRHTHAEIADAAGDTHAASRIMGHALPGSKDPYIRVTPDRLRKVVDHVRFHVTGLQPDQAPLPIPSAASGLAASSSASRPARAAQSRPGGRAKRRAASSP